ARRVDERAGRPRRGRLPPADHVVVPRALQPRRSRRRRSGERGALARRERLRPRPRRGVRRALRRGHRALPPRSRVGSRRRAAALAGVAGCAMVGLGIANIIPLLFSGAGRVPGIPAGTALAAVATTGYLGFLAGPPLIGLASDAIGLPSALGIVSASCALVAV